MLFKLFCVPFFHQWKLTLLIPLPHTDLPQTGSYSYFKHEVWPPGSADTVCPRLPLMTQYSILFPELRRGRDETYRRCELMTLTFDFGGHGACGWWVVVLHPCTKFEVRICLAIRKLWRTMCVSINGPDPDLRPFDLETGMRVASKVKNLPSKFQIWAC